MLSQPSNDIRDKHLKSLMDVVFENSKKQLVQMRNQLAKEPENLAKKERDFLFKECSKLENIGRLQARLDEYRENSSKLNPGQRAKEAKGRCRSDKLGDHLRAIGRFKLAENWHAHHIVCSRHGSHAAARLKVFAYMGIDDPFNGCWLPVKNKYARGTVQKNAVGHAYLHTNKYADWVQRELRAANSKNDLINRLNEIRLKLIDARQLPDILTDKGKQDLRTTS